MRDAFSISIHIGSQLITCALFALPPALIEKSWKRFGLAWLQFLFGVYLPLGLFLLSCLQCPEWKGACKLGWWDCLMQGKFWLAPLMLWGVAAFYVDQVCRLKWRDQAWVGLGLFAGTLNAFLCTVYALALGLAYPLTRLEWPIFILAPIPFYMTAWGAWRLILFHRRRQLDPRSYIATGLAILPFWIASLLTARKIYALLPDNPPECFVVTAATRGHEKYVGPFQPCARAPGGRANAQLLTFWAFEERWSRRSPASHRAFRRVYNLAGPLLARGIRNPWVADAVHLALRPLERMVR